jgi:hypothetical protein
MASLYDAVDHRSLGLVLGDIAVASLASPCGPWRYCAAVWQPAALLALRLASAWRLQLRHITDHLTHVPCVVRIVLEDFDRIRRSVESLLG